MAPLALRVGLIGCVALLLLNPVARTVSSAANEKPPFLFLLDTSRSMRTSDTENNVSRWRTAKRLTLENRALLEALTERYAVHFAGFDRKFQSATPESLRKTSEPGGEGTAIADALRQAGAMAGGTQTGQNETRGGVLLVSDGRDNGSGSAIEAAKTAKAAGLPVYTFCVGQARQEQDISVTAQRPQTWAAPNQFVELSAALHDTDIPRTDAQIDLRRDGRIVQSKTVTIQPGTREISFTVREATPGAYHYSIACRQVPGETNPANNRANISLAVLQGRVKILLLQDGPTWDSKFLTQVLLNDPTIALNGIIFVTDTKQIGLRDDFSPPNLHIPRTAAEFAAYDIIIIGKGFDKFFDANAASALKQWVSERGGNLVLLGGKAGESNAILRELSPLVFGANEKANVRVHLTDAGREYPGFQARGSEEAQTAVPRLPPLLSATETQGEKALSVVLARGGTSENATDADAPEPALLAYQRYGQGKVMALVGDGLWRWAFPPPEQAQYAPVYADFWTQTVRWLVSDSDFLPGQSVSLVADRAAYSQNEAVNLLGHYRAARPISPPVISLTAPDGKQTKLVAALSNDGADFTASFRPAQPGDYFAEAQPIANAEKSAPIRAAFTVYPGQQEDGNVSADPELLRRIAAAGGGQSLTEADLPALPEKLHAAALSALPQNGSRTLWDNGLLLIALLALYFLPLFLKRK